MNQSHIFGGHQLPAGLQRESTEDMSKMYTTLYDNEDPVQQEYFNQQNQQYRYGMEFQTAYSAPDSPVSDCYSVSSGSPLESPYSSPLTSNINSMDSKETDELTSLFNITIEDLLSADPITFQYPADFTAENVNLFGTDFQQAQSHSHNHSHNHNNEIPFILASQTPCFSTPQSPSYHEYDTDMETSPSPPATPHAGFSPLTPVKASMFPNTDGMTVMRGEDGAVMVYNPKNESMTFRCEMCPNEKFGRIHDLKRHHQSKHQSKSWPCEFCQRQFARRDALLRHYTVKAERADGVHPTSYQTDLLAGARARAKLI